jgi:hypothetical protein
MGHIEATHMAELDPFELLPEPLARIQFRGVGRQAFQMEALRRAVGQEFFDDVAAVDRRAIPANHDLARHLPQQVFEKCDPVVRVEGVALAMEVERALGREGAARGEMVARAPLPQDGRVAHRRIRAYHTGQGIEAGFVYEEAGLPLGLRPFLMAGQVCSRQCAMAASSR